MASKVPPLEQTKAVALRALGAAGLKNAEAKFVKSYGNSVKDPAMQMWLICKQNGLEVEEIKATSEGGEGTPVMISEIIALAKSPKDQGWTFVNGGNFEQPDSQDKYSITGVILSTEEGKTSTGKPKLDFRIADASGIAKGVAYADAAGLFVEAKAKPGSVVTLPLANVQYGHHNFGKEKNAVWWKFAVPPFGAVLPLEADPREYFLSLEDDNVKEGKACYTRGFITHVGERTNEVCGDGESNFGCNRWIMEKRPDDHDKCKEKAEEEGVEYATREVVSFEGTFTSVNGETRKLNLAKKPKVKIAVDLVEVFGSLTKSNAIEVAFIRQANAEEAEEQAEEPAPAPKKAVAAKPAPKAPVKAKPAPVAVEETEEPEEAEEEQAEEEEAPAPPPKPAPKKVVAKVAPKPAPKPAPEPEEDAEEPTEDEEQPEDAEEAIEEPKVVVKAATKTPTAAKGPQIMPKKAAAAQTTVQEVPEAILKHIEKSCKQFGGKNRVFVITRTAVGAGLLGEVDEETARSQMEAYIAAAVEAGHCEYDTPAKNGVRWL